MKHLGGAKFAAWKDCSSGYCTDRSRASVHTWALIQDLEVLAGRCEVFQDLIDDLLLQVRIAADAHAVRQGQHKTLLHLQCTSAAQLPALRQKLLSCLPLICKARP